MKTVCLNCGHPYADFGTPYQCPACGGLYDDIEPLTFGQINQQQPGIWRYAASFGFQADVISLGEGSTPLIAAKTFGRDVYFKCEYSNPTGSFKDRGTATLLSFLLARGVKEVIEDSSGNAGASLAAYAAKAGIKVRIFAPENASGPKRKQIELYGAELVSVPGARSNAAEMVRKAADANQAYASHAYLPFNLPGYATCAYEIVEQLGTAPGAVLLPAGQGGLLLGIGRGFQALLRAGKIRKMPVIVGVQAAACAPLTALFNMGMLGLNFVTEADTLAEGIRVRSPLRAEAVMRVVRESGGRFVVVDETSILAGRDALGRLGFYVEPTSAVVWRGLQEMLPELADPVVGMLTGAGYKVRV